MFSVRQHIYNSLIVRVTRYQQGHFTKETALRIRLLTVGEQSYLVLTEIQIKLLTLQNFVLNLSNIFWKKHNSFPLKKNIFFVYLQFFEEAVHNFYGSEAILANASFQNIAGLSLARSVIAQLIWYHGSVM